MGGGYDALRGLEHAFESLAESDGTAANGDVEAQRTRGPRALLEEGFVEAAVEGLGRGERAVRQVGPHERGLRAWLTVGQHRRRRDLVLVADVHTQQDVVQLAKGERHARERHQPAQPVAQVARVLGACIGSVGGSLGACIGSLRG